MLRNRKDYPSVITPKGVVAWASIDTPDYEYKKEEGEFHIRVRFDPNDPGVQALSAQAEQLLDEAYEAKKAELTREKKGALLKKMFRVPALKPELERESGDETGFVIVRAGMLHHITIKNGPRAGEEFFKYPDVFDARGRKLNRKDPKTGKVILPKVGSGSEVKLSIKIMEYFLNSNGEMGIKFELEGLQIIKLVQGGSRDAASYGFTEEEGDAIDVSGGFEDEGAGYEGGDGDDNPEF